MVTVVLELSPGGCLSSLQAEGHAGGGKPGGDPVCAAVSALVRTALHVLHEEPGVRCEGAVPAEGRAAIMVNGCADGAAERLRGITDFLVTGFSDLAADFPRHITVRLTRKTMEESNGT